MTLADAALLFGFVRSPRSQQALPSGELIRDASLLYPLTEGTISQSLLFGLVFGLPAALAVILNALAAPPRGAARLSAAALSRGLRDVHHLMLSVLEAYAWASCFKIWLNVSVGRHRPDWYARVAGGDKAELREGRASYPSGHAAYSHAAGAACFWYLTARLRVFCSSADAPPRLLFARLVLATAPVGLATAIGTTRLTDYRHNFSDVNAGTVIGLAAGSACYFLNFALPGSVAADGQQARARRALGRWAVAASESGRGSGSGSGDGKEMAAQAEDGGAGTPRRGESLGVQVAGDAA
jgi:diacylglycerol diphosphate phosphatase/phosphatidate phosphatase